MSTGERNLPGNCSNENKIDGVREFLVEHRPRLQSASVFIHLGDSVRESVKVSVKPTEILLKFPTRTLKVLLEQFTLNTRSLTSMVASGRHISFRINTNHGQFDEEVISEGNPSGFSQGLIIPVNIKANQTFDIVCGNCRAPLVPRGSIFLRRILELPSENADASDWFCHKHTGGTGILTPKLDEILYGHYFFTMNRRSVVNVREKNSLIYCQRCLQMLGKSLEGERMKFWNENVIFITEKHEELHLMPNTNQMSNFCTIVRKILLDFTMAGQCGLVHFQKIAFNCHLPDGKVLHLLLQIVDKNLEVYRGQEDSEEDCIHLIHGSAMKVMYQGGQEAEVPQIKEWLDDSNVTHMEISFQMLKNALDTFAENSQILPQVYRSSCGFHLSYLFSN